MKIENIKLQKTLVSIIAAHMNELIVATRPTMPSTESTTEINLDVDDEFIRLYGYTPSDVLNAVMELTK